ncbi:MAG: GNAT family N-acetyltransferase [Cyclobacteriaceae bacterium]|nr:GNAT family N-acetyltransferase [Cyclobacteriaceae bacterium]
MLDLQYIIKESGPLEAFEVAAAIPEFGNNAYDLQEYQKRLTSPSLVLTAYSDTQAVGFKAGYQRGDPKSFYSWMGGVLPDYRRKGLARELAVQQEAWARSHGFERIWFKTRNRNRAMLHFALDNDFYIREVIPKIQPADYRIILEKKL